MAVTLTVPLWLAIAVGLLVLWSILDRLLIPSARWFLRRRVNRVVEEINTRLKIRIPAFKLTKREVLIDRLLYDPRVQEAAEAEARDTRMPRQAVQARVEQYAREIVPAFNAYVFSSGILARQEPRALALPSAPRLLRRGGSGEDRRQGDRRVSDQPQKQHGLHPRLLPGRREERPLLCGRRVGPHLAAPDAHPSMGAYSCGATRTTPSIGVSSSATWPWRRPPASRRRSFPKGGSRATGGCARRNWAFSTTWFAPSTRPVSATSPSCRSGSITTVRSRTGASSPSWTRRRRRPQPAARSTTRSASSFETSG